MDKIENNLKRFVEEDCGTSNAQERVLKFLK